MSSCVNSDPAAISPPDTVLPSIEIGESNQGPHVSREQQQQGKEGRRQHRQQNQQQQQQERRIQTQPHNNPQKPNPNTEPNTNNPNPKPPKHPHFSPNIQIIPRDVPLLNPHPNPNPHPHKSTTPNIPKPKPKPTLRPPTQTDLDMRTRALHELIHIAERRVRTHYRYLRGEGELDRAFAIDERVMRRRARRWAYENSDGRGLVVRRDRGGFGTERVFGSGDDGFMRKGTNTERRLRVESDCSGRGVG